MNTHPHQPVILRCSCCESVSFEIEFFNASMFIRCTNCKVFHQHLLSKLSEGMFAPSTILVPQQEPAVQVPATAPAAGHLSTEPSDTLLHIDPYAGPEASFAQCPKCTSKFFAPAVGFEQLLLICENCETGFAFSDPVNTWPQADQCHIPDLSTESVDK